MQVGRSDNLHIAKILHCVFAAAARADVDCPFFFFSKGFLNFHHLPAVFAAILINGHLQTLPEVSWALVFVADAAAFIGWMAR